MQNQATENFRQQKVNKQKFWKQKCSWIFSETLYKQKSQNVTFKNTNDGLLKPDQKYCLFTTKERSNVIIESENSIPGKVINESLIENNLIGQDQSQIYNFDSVFNESVKQERFYRSAVSPAIKSFVEGQNASIILFGPSDSGKSFTLKGKTGVERGILPRAIEDIFNIVKNSEQREEDFEAMNQRMMQYSDEEDGEQMYPESQNVTRNADYSRFQSNSRNMNVIDQESIVPERMFLKISIYQIFVDKVLDLLTTTQPIQRIQVDSYLDRDTQEVVSKIKNVTEKAIFSVEDFYSVLQEAYKNRRIESSNMHEQELRKKSHFVIGLTLMKRSHSKRMIELSSLNFVELTGSEQAASDERYYKDTSIKQFVTKSFNGISSQILKSALNKKQTSVQDDGDIKIVNCINLTLTSASNIVLICNVNPSPQCYEHSLPAIKFCSRIRECILKKIGRNFPQQQMRESYQSINSHRDINLEDTQSNFHSSRLQNDQDQYKYSSIQTIKEIIDLIKDELANRALQGQDAMSDQYSDIWVSEKIQTIENLSQRLRSQSNSYQNEKQKILLQQELDFLREQISRNQRYQSTINSPRISLHQQQDSDYRVAPYSQERQSYNSNIYNNDGDQYYQRRDIARVEQDRVVSDVRSIDRNQQYASERQQSRDMYPKTHQIEIYDQQQDYQHRMNATQTPSFATLQPINIVQPSAINPSQTQRIILKPHTLQSQRLPLSPSQSQSHLSSNEVIEYNNGMESRGISRQLSGIDLVQQNFPGSSNVTFTENEFCNKHPFMDKTIQGQQNSLSQVQSPDSSHILISGQQQKQGYRAMPKNMQQLQKSNKSQQDLNSSQIINLTQVPINNTTLLKNPLASFNPVNQSIKSVRSQQSTQQVQQMSQRAQLLRQSSVYQSEQEAQQDLSRLSRLNDTQAMHSRVLEMYREKQDQEQLIQQYQSVAKELIEEQKEQANIIEEQEGLLKDAQQEFQNTIDDINQQRLDQEQSNSVQAHSVTGHLIDLQNKIHLLEKQLVDQSCQMQQYKDENVVLAREKESFDQQMEKLGQENERHKHNYQILKEHEMSIIKDLDVKKNREILFYEQKITDLTKQLQEEHNHQKKTEESIFQMKEEMMKIENDYQKVCDDRKQLMKEIQSLGDKVEQEQENKQELKKQINQLDNDLQQLHQENNSLQSQKTAAIKEIEKLHQLIEEMDKTIQNKDSQIQSEIENSKQKQQEIQLLEQEKQELQKVIETKDLQLDLQSQRDNEYQQQLSQLSQLNESLERQLTLIKAKEYDKVDLMKRGAEVEARLIYFQADNEQLVRERNQLDLANVQLARDKNEMQQQMINQQQELEFFKNAHEQHLDKFDSKFEQISSELLKLKTENLSLKEKDKQSRRQIRDFEDEKEELLQRLRISDRKTEEATQHLQDLEREVRSLLNEKERDIKDNAFQKMSETKFKDENRGRMLEDIQNMISSYKQQKNLGKSGYTSGGNGGFQNGYSTHSSGYY